MNRLTLTLPLALALAVTLGTAQATPPANRPPENRIDNWIATWTASPQPVWGSELPLPIRVPATLTDQTVRQVLRVSSGGQRVRVVLSNEYGTEPLRIGAAHVAMAVAGSAITAGSDRVLRFGGEQSTTIPPGAKLLSDPVELDVATLARLAVTLYLPAKTLLTTFHWDGKETAYLAAGNRVAAARLDTNSRLEARLFLTDVLVDSPTNAGTVVALGDSITDGNGSTSDSDRRWPDFLAQRLAKERITVLNAGISGGRLLQDGMGSSALARFNRDVLSQPQLKSVVVLLGINDISWAGTSFAPHAAPPSADSLIVGYRQLIAQARLRKVRIIGATLLPFEGALDATPLQGYYNADKDKLRQAINQWIRSSGEFDAVVDFDALTRDPARPSRLLPRYDSGDHLHPGDAGYQAMADSLDHQTLLGKR
ncbi:SGNH/GDSL hydrolase family protein [Neisseriaceae bacterium JH1-16]|nr:SGNH/GDSL hydrolase family protein [Neisseriaceae bacterium JH1-16]